MISYFSIRPSVRLYVCMFVTRACLLGFFSEILHNDRKLETEKSNRSGVLYLPWTKGPKISPNKVFLNFQKSLLVISAGRNLK